MQGPRLVRESGNQRHLVLFPKQGTNKMMALTCVGNLGGDPVEKQVGSNTVVNFSLAVRTGKDQTSWAKCSVWGARGDTVMRYFNKGDTVSCSGKAKLREFSKDDGTTGQSLEMDVMDFTLPLRSKKDNQGDVPF